MLCGIALSRLHINTEAFYALTPIEFDYALKDINNEMKANQRLPYEVARFMLMHQWNMQGRFLKHKMKRVQDVTMFTWEQEENEKGSEQSVTTMKTKLLNIYAAFGGKKNRNNGRNSKSRTIDGKHRSGPDTSTKGLASNIE